MEPVSCRAPITTPSILIFFLFIFSGCLLALFLRLRRRITIIKRKGGGKKKGNEIKKEIIIIIIKKTHKKKNTFAARMKSLFERYACE